ncbi:Fibronectin-binding protein [Streptococcus dysgalactiae subsp. equisimilis]|uniref:Fibronectin-binding protein n=2 Tax=Streptococcus dysgalactiae TaxID=1334 RepID=A0A9X8SXJ7_STREQ|nr:Fibronectin-binding protein [Streptococcus dysgalactiae subsp. equisimilis]VEF04698.1 Fibronectin-binding protein [Streptococcus dysgalactiae subsp. equisimilis]
MSNCKYKLRKLSVGLVSVGIMFTATTVMGEEVSEIASISSAITSPTTQIEEEQDSQTGELVASRSASQSTSSLLTVEPDEQPQKEEEIVKTEEQEEEEAPKTLDHAGVTSATDQEGSEDTTRTRKRRSVEEAPQTMEVEKFEVDKENTQLNLKDDPDKSKQLIKNRDGEQREIAKITREIKVSENTNELDVTITVTPKEIDNGADVIVLLDTSKKMTEEQFKNAKEGITQLVTTLTGSVNDDRNRNTVRLIDFYREVGKPISLSGLSKEELGKKLDEVRQKAYDRWNWGVDLQGAIHEARELFKREAKSNPSLKKHQHIVLFSQGEATFSYALSENAKKQMSRVNDSITSSNATASWLPIFSHTNRNANMIDDAQKIIGWAKSIGLGDKLSSIKTAIDFASGANKLLGLFGVSPTEYLTLKEYQSKNTLENDFDYTQRVGEGYYNYSFDKRKVFDMPFKPILDSQLGSAIKPKKESWLGWVLDKLSLTETYTNTSKAAIMKAIESIFYKREDIYYNHNLSAQAEANMAKKEGITFYSFDLKKDNKSISQKFDKYLREMSEGRNLFTEVSNAEKFKNMVTELTITDTFDKNVSVKNKSWTSSLDSEDEQAKDAGTVTYNPASNGNWWKGSSPEKLTWTISKDEFQKALKKGEKLTLNYKLLLNKDKIISNSQAKTRKKRSTSTENNDSLTEKIISNKISYKINSKSANGQKLEDVKLTYSKVMVPVPDVDGTIEIPKAPEKRLVDPVLPSQSVFPDMPKYDEAETSYGSSEIIDIEEDTGSGIEMGAASGAISTQENTDPIVEITEDTQTGMSGHSEDITIIEDTKLEKTDTIIGGNVIDFTEDSIPDNQYAESGQNSVDDNEVTEDTKPESNTIILGGQSDPVDLSEDTLPNVSGHSGDITITEDTKQPEVIIGGQSDPVDLSEDTAPGMSGFNEGTVVEEDTRPKLQFHFDNEEPIPTINKAISQTPIARVDNNLPQTGDKDKSEAFFTIAALTVIGAAGLLIKKDRKNQID